MATVIKIKNTDLNKAPVDGNGDSVLATGELAYSYYTGAQNNFGDRIFIGTGTEVSGLSATYATIGGKYFTDLLDHVHGTLTASSGVVVDSNKKIDEWRVDNLVLNGNTLSVDQVSDANGNISVIPGGTTGDVIITARDTTINGTVHINGVQTHTGNLDVTGSGSFTTTLNVDGQATLASLNVEDLTTTRIVYVGSTGELVDDAGFTFTGSGAGGNLQLLGNINVDVEATLASAVIEDLTNNRIVIAGTGGAVEDDANFTFNGTAFDIGQGDFTVDVATGNTFVNGTLETQGLATLNTAVVENLTDNRIVVAGSTSNLEDDGNFTFDGTTFKVGTSVTDKFRVGVAAGNVATTGTLDVDGAVNLNATLDVDGQATIASLNVEDLTASRVTFAGASGELVDNANFTFDNAANKLSITGSAQIDNLILDGNVLSTSTGTLTFTPAANAETIISSTSALRLPVGNSTERPSTAATGQIRYNTTTNQYEGYSSSAWQGLGGVIDVDQNTYVIAQPTPSLVVPGSTADTLYFVTGGVLQATIDTATGLTVNNLNIDNNTISTTTGDLYLDPGKTGAGSPTGNVVVYGNLQVMGTTTEVNSTTVTIDDPIFTLGGDTAPASDDNKDRGIEFRWHDGSSAKVGFFGWDDSASRFKFVNDATNVSEVFSGSAGDVEFGNTLIDSMTFSATNFTANTVPWVDVNGDVGFLNENGASPYGTEGQVIQMNASGIPVFGHIDCGTY
tara:strand:+ start:2356 stop:4557 length:2202 start_codon:yes stop_codon:yes gene_type:complete